MKKERTFMQEHERAERIGNLIAVFIIAFILGAVVLISLIVANIE